MQELGSLQGASLQDMAREATLCAQPGPCQDMHVASVACGWVLRKAKEAEHVDPRACNQVGMCCRIVGA